MSTTQLTQASEEAMTYFEVRKVANQPTPTGIGTTNMYQIVDTDTGEVVSRHWNSSDANSTCRYKNKVAGMRTGLKAKASQ
jgi:hypothetical protein